MKRKKPSKTWKIGQVKHFPFEQQHRALFDLPKDAVNPARYSVRQGVKTMTYYCDVMIGGLEWRCKASISKAKLLEWAREKAAAK